MNAPAEAEAAAPPAPAAPWSPPDEVDEYRLLRPLGAGTAGRVFLAHDTLLERAVAVKFLAAPDSSSLARFLIEARQLHLEAVEFLLVDQLVSAKGKEESAAGDHDDVGMWRFFAQPTQGFQTIDARQPDVEENNIIGVLRDFLQATFTTRDRFRGEAFVFEDAFQRLPDAGLVIDNEDSWHTGSSTTNRVPLGEFGSAPI